ncbi:hypothetical protein WHI96_03990 [Pseudonocardia tropica]|uniref:Uncharacterized protein n=1 Tax=Pseudonocardia tropica TaxID=681289 RepID=A0ABV1JPV9_9PSEU
MDTRDPARSPVVGQAVRLDEHERLDERGRGRRGRDGDAATPAVRHDPAPPDLLDRRRDRPDRERGRVVHRGTC